MGGVLNILDEAKRLVDGERDKTYGHPYDDFEAVRSAANSLGVDPRSGPLHHSLYMVLVKIQRLVQTPDHHDSIVDGAGYFRTYQRVLERIASNVKPAPKKKPLDPGYYRWKDTGRGDELVRVSLPSPHYDEQVKRELGDVFIDNLGKRYAYNGEKWVKDGD